MEDFIKLENNLENIFEKTIDNQPTTEALAHRVNASAFSPSPNQMLNQFPKQLLRSKPSRIAIALFAFIPLSVFATVANSAGGTKDVKFRDTSLEIQDGDRFVITGIRGTIHLAQTGGQVFGSQNGLGSGRAAATVGANLPVLVVGGASAQNSEPTATVVTALLRARKTLNEKGLSQWGSKFDSLALQTRRDGHVIYIEAKTSAAAQDWLDWTAPNSPEMNIELSVNSIRGIPAEVSLHSGSVDVRGWQANVSATVVQGSIRTEDTLGDLQVQVQHGEMRILKQHGAVDVDSFQGKLVADHVEGDIHLDNFSGDSSLRNVAGNVFVRTHSGPTNVADSNGAIDFELGRGALNVAKFEGPVRGQTDTAPVIAKLEGESDVNIESAQGPVAVRLPASSGAAIRLQTETGTLTAPEEIRPSQTTSSKFASGRMKGAGPKGSVTIKSKAASIRVRPEVGGASSRSQSEPEAPIETRALAPESSNED